jgi:hypothetical protein
MMPAQAHTLRPSNGNTKSGLPENDDSDMVDVRRLHTHADLTGGDKRHCRQRLTIRRTIKY